MTIDERLDRLTERHEALTQTIELLTHDVSELRATVKVSGTLDTKTNTILADAITAAETRR
jgi:prefoldin subunit 5